jgi:ABC-type glutathione transport system ATPase component
MSLILLAPFTELSAWHPSLPRLRRDESSNSCGGHRTRGHCALSAMLTVSQLSKSYAGRALFDDVSLQVNRGDRIGLVGKCKS